VSNNNFFGSSAQAAAQAAAQSRAQAQVQFQQNVASMEPPKNQTARREMSGPTGVDDILQSFAEARRNDSMDGTAAFPEVPASPAVAAAIEIQSMGSDDIGSTTESRAGRGRRRRQAVGNTLSLNV
jgi:hypothetical protein